MKKIPFGAMPDGTAVEQYTLADGRLECEILTYGGALRALRVPARDGRMVDVLLGFDRLEDYLSHDKYLGALVGRYANRIGGASFELNGVRYPLAANNGGNHLHGGAAGYDKRGGRWRRRGTASSPSPWTAPTGRRATPAISPSG